jgi:hypothetical protein
MSATVGYPFTALVAATPIIMAAIMVALGIWNLFQQPGPVRIGVFLAAVLIATMSTLSLIGYGGTIANGLYVYGTTIQVPNQALVGLGQTVLYLGLFVATTSGVAVAVQRRQQAAE